MDSTNYELNNSFIRSEAKEALKGKWLLTNLSWIGLIIVTTIVSRIFAQVHLIAYLLVFLINTPLNSGMIYLSLGILDNDTAEPKLIFRGLTNIWNILSCTILTTIYFILWTIIFTAPILLIAFFTNGFTLYSLIILLAITISLVSLIKSIDYSQALYIIADNRECGPNEAITKSKQLMKGHKLDYFFMTSYLTLINVLCAITIVGLFYSLPYTLVSLTNFYKHLKKSNY